MMEVNSLTDLYNQVNPDADKVFVVPLIRYKFKKTDYLYLLYQDLIENKPGFTVSNISVFSHFKFVLAAIFSRNHILHYHWLEFQDLKALSAMPYKLVCIGLYKLFGGKIVWTIHNLTPHDRQFLKLHLRIHRWMAGISTQIHVHSNSAVQIVAEKYLIPADKIMVFPHPAFPADIKPKKESRINFLDRFNRHKAHIERPTLLIFGQLSEYKGIAEAIRIIKKIEIPFNLWVVGPIKKGQDNLHETIIELSSDDERIIYIPQFIPEDDYSLLLSSADICVFNYKTIFTSGGVMMAKSYKREIIAPNMGILKDLEPEDNVHLFDTQADLSTLIIQKLTELNG